MKHFNVKVSTFELKMMEKKIRRGFNVKRQIYIKDKAKCSTKAMQSFQLSSTVSASPADFEVEIKVLHSYSFDQTELICSSWICRYVCLYICVCSNQTEASVFTSFLTDCVLLPSSDLSSGHVITCLCAGQLKLISGLFFLRGRA